MGQMINRRRVMSVAGYPPDVLMTIETNPEVLAVCYAQGWCSKKKYMTYSEAAAVTSIGDAFKWAGITHFNEFEYFTSITTLSDEEFRYATALKEITLPSTLISISNNCYAFQNVILDKFICKSQYLTSLGGGYTYRNATIKYAYIDSPIAKTSSWQNPFQAEHLVLGEHVEQFIARLLRLTQFEANEGLEVVGNFTGNNVLTSLTLPSTVNNIDGEGFRNCTALTSLTVKNPVPFTISGYTFLNTNANLQIYVPAASVDAYKAANVWRGKASVIQAIPT